MIIIAAIAGICLKPILVSGRKRFSFKDIEVYSIAKALQESINLSDFRCEKPIFADYLRTTAVEDDRNNVAKVWLFVTHDKQAAISITLSIIITISLSSLMNVTSDILSLSRSGLGYPSGSNPFYAVFLYYYKRGGRHSC
jgi:hypothetical protein